MSDERGTSGGGFLVAFLAGAAAGAVVALLTSPKSGREMRESLAEWLRRSGAADRLERAARLARDAVDARRDG